MTFVTRRRCQKLGSVVATQLYSVVVMSSGRILLSTAVAVTAKTERNPPCAD
jgi:hypothetical protein